MPVSAGTPAPTWAPGGEPIHTQKPEALDLRLRWDRTTSRTHAAIKGVSSTQIATDPGNIETLRRRIFSQKAAAGVRTSTLFHVFDHVTPIPRSSSSSLNEQFKTKRRNIAQSLFAVDQLLSAGVQEPRR